MKRMIFSALFLFFFIHAFAQKREVGQSNSAYRSLIQEASIKNIACIAAESKVTGRIDVTQKIPEQKPIDEGFVPKIKCGLKKGFDYEFDLRLGIGKEIFFGGNIWMGYRFNSCLSLLGGFGVSKAIDSDFERKYGVDGRLFPLMVRLRFNFINEKKVSPILTFDSGYFVPIGDDTKGVFSVSFMTGTRISIFGKEQGKGAVNLSVGCQVGNSRFIVEDGSDSFLDPKNVSLIFVAGFSF